MNLSDKQIIFTLGCFGALAPEVLRLYRIRNKPRPNSWSWFYFVISIVFAVLGGVVAIILPATTFLAAFYAGISTPLIINTVLKNAPQPGEGAVKEVQEAVDYKKTAVPDVEMDEEFKMQARKDYDEMILTTGTGAKPERMVLGTDPKPEKTPAARGSKLKFRDFINSL